MNNLLIFDIRRYTIHDGPGIRTTVFFKGCPLRCWWCHNPESQETGIEQVIVKRVLDGMIFESMQAVGSWRPAEEVMNEIAKDEVFYRESGGGVTFSGGEPLMQPDALRELIMLCKEKGYHTAIDTSGIAEPSSLKKVIGQADLWLFDLKLMNDISHLEFTGVSNELALRNLETLARQGKEIIIRFPLIPGITDEPENLEMISMLMKKLKLDRIDILPYHSIAKEKYQRMKRKYLAENIQEPNNEMIEKTVSFFTQQGFTAKNQ
jgi:pyruvate formate lyase activating enzyme